MYVCIYIYMCVCVCVWVCVCEFIKPKTIRNFTLIVQMRFIPTPRITVATVLQMTYYYALPDGVQFRAK